MVGSRSRLITFDTSIVLLQSGARPVEPDEPQRFRQLVEDSRGAIRLGIPAPALAECGGIRLMEGFECLDFTLDAAYYAQQFIVRTKGEKSASPLSRQRLKVDALILGTCLAHGANALYTANLRDFENMMKRVPDSKLVISKLPKLREWQPALAGLDDPER